MVTPAADALWITSWPLGQYVKHRWPGAWVCSAFRREPGAPRASDLIRDALAATRWWFGDPPALGLVTFVDPDEIRSTNPGYCFLMAGFERDGETVGGLPALRMRREMIPEPIAPIGAQLQLVVA